MSTETRQLSPVRVHGPALPPSLLPSAHRSPADVQEEYKAYSDRADYAEKRLAVLSERMAKIESLLAADPGLKPERGSGGGADPAVAKAVQTMKDTVTKSLVSLRKSLVRAQKYTKKVDEENARLKSENKKLQYRVTHLKRSLDAAQGADSKQSTA